MSNASYLFMINMAVAALLASAFWLISVWSERPASSRVLALSYALGTGYYACEFIIPFLADARLMVVASFTTLLVATLIFCAGLAVEFSRKPAWAPMLAVLAISPVLVYFAQDLPRQSYLRMYAYQAPYAAMLAIGVIAIWRPASRRNVLGRVLLGILAASVLHFLAKPLIAHAMGGWGANPQSYFNSAYALVSQATGTVLSLATALTTLALLIRELLHSAKVKSEVDNLSGLYNRRGFERAAEQAFAKADLSHRPVTLILADIDRFKSVNDRFGHAAGDRVIQAFADLIKTSLPGKLGARMGGEEFAIVLVGADTNSGRLLAEGVRNAFANSSFEGLDGQQVTASFGVAERAPGEPFSRLMHRADLALYEAKGHGRDCVRVAPYVAGLARGDLAMVSDRGLTTSVTKR